MGHVIFAIAMISAIVVVAVTILYFEILMIIDAAKNPKLTTNQRILWVAGMLICHPIIAILYYFLGYSHRSVQ